MDIINISIFLFYAFAHLKWLENNLILTMNSKKSNIDLFFELLRCYLVTLYA